MGLHMVFSPQTGGVPFRNFMFQNQRQLFVAVQLLDIPLPAFHVCAMDAPLWAEGAYVSAVAVCGVCSSRWTGLQHFTYTPSV